MKHIAFIVVLIAVAGCSEQLRIESKPIAKEPPVVEQLAAAAPIGAAFPDLPEGCSIWARGKAGNEWQTTARMILFKCPDGDTEIQFMEDGAVEVRTFGQQTVRFMAVTGVRAEIGKPTE